MTCVSHYADDRQCLAGIRLAAPGEWTADGIGIAEVGACNGFVDDRHPHRRRSVLRGEEPPAHELNAKSLEVAQA